ncbi:MAG: M23 family metallopeptidase [Gammaproteobacteria bacterium]|nr:M23 family metallopeptidase [Gammaproteobacteria bacterium]NNF60425.1 M23 family metallopeptidase [Gammaproteobacteria bacterium]NNM20647.1 M23 family metallopeptidase [Gammaproteobacteria bacterium]
MLVIAAVVLVLGYLPPERGVLPVEGASVDSWDPLSFWYTPWGVSGVHKGIDIFAPQGTAVLAATHGIVTYAGRKSLGGNVVLILGPKWRLHYYAHLESSAVRAFQPVRRGQRIGSVGDSGNAAGKPHHLHYVIRTPFPIPWMAQPELEQGWKRMFFFDPVERFRAWQAI